NRGSAFRVPAPGLQDLGDCSIQEKIDFEMRMREGICKLLAVSTQKEQILHATKNLMVCNARILAYRTKLLRKTEESTMNRTTEQSVISGFLQAYLKFIFLFALDLRIPLMWKDSDHFSSKDRTQRYSVFCLFKIGTQVFDTDLVIVDKAVTDICFESVTIFEEAGPDFQLKVEVYSCCCTEELSTIVNTPKKLVKKLKTSIGKATGKKLNSTLDDGNLESLLLTDTIVLGAKYNLLAHTSLGLENVEDNFKTHSLTVVGNEESSFWIPLYGSMCCRLVAQPSCMTRDMMTGFLNHQQTVGNLTSWQRLYCVLRGGKLLCYCTPEETEARVEPTLTVSVNKETRIHAADKNTQNKNSTFSVISPGAGEAMYQLFAVESQEDFYKWMEAFWQHFYDFSQWKHCCEEFMKVEIMSPRKQPLFLTKEATSVYQDMSIDSPAKHEAVINIMQQKTEEASGGLLIGEEEEEEDAPPSWAAIFDGSHQMRVEKNRLSGANEEDVNLHEGKGKKRRAPLPPSDKSPYTLAKQTSNQQGKENIWNNSPLLCRKNSPDSCLSSVLFFKQPLAAAHKPVSCQKGTSADREGPAPSARKAACGDKPIPALRQKLIRETDAPVPCSWG
uniref:Rhotekin 2 n=1 Tax=Varanus komodoensis TaxID=61221 RepID=A0A8D2LMC0_VARKO